MGWGSWQSSFGLSEGTSTHVTASGQSYSWYYKPRRGKSAARCELSIPIGNLVEFTLEKEGFTHRIVKALGFATEFQTQDLEFDDKCYILCDDQRFFHQLRGSVAVRRAVQQTLVNAARYIKVKNGQLIAEMRDTTPLPDKSVAEPVADTLYKLKQCAESLGGMPMQPSSMKLYSHIAIGICFVLMALGIIGLTMQPHVLNNYWGLAKQAAVYSLPALVVALFLLRLVFQGSAHGYYVLLAFFFVGIPSMMMCSYSLMYQYNTRYDTGLPKTVIEPILRKFTTTHKSRTTYHLDIQNWQEGDSVDLKVDYATYARARNSIRLIVRPGRLGWQWIEHYEVLP